MKINISSFIQSKVISTALGETGGVKVDKLTVTSNPKKTEYYVGETLDLEGVVVEAEIGSLKGEVTKDCTFTPEEGTVITPDIETVTVKYGNTTAEIELSLRQPLSISISGLTKTDYLVGDALDLTGIQVTAEYRQLKSAADVTEYCTFSPTNGTILSQGDDSVTANFLGLTASTPINVYAVESIAVTTQPTKTTYEPGQKFNYSGIVVTGYANSGAITSNVTNDCTFNPANNTTVLGTDGTYQTTVTYRGLTTTFNYTISSIPATLQDCTWTQIQKFIKDGTLLTHYSLGATKTLSYDGNTYTMVLARVNDGSSKAEYYPNKTADFISKEVTPPVKYHNSSPWPNTWSASNMRTWLNSTVYDALPTELKNVIVTKKKTTKNTNTGAMSDTTTDKIWMPTVYEMVGTTSIMPSGSTNTQFFGDESSYNIQYTSVFNNTTARLRNKVGTSTKSKYWSMSGYGTSAPGMRPYVNTSSADSYPTGVYPGQTVDKTDTGTLICFRIG